MRLAVIRWKHNATRQHRREAWDMTRQIGAYGVVYANCGNTWRILWGKA